MVAYNFQGRFADLVESGEKLQTIRQKSRAKPGDILQLYTGQRTSGCRKLAESKCCAVDWVVLKPEGPEFGQPGWWPKDKDLFAKRDGFDCYDLMWDWFWDQYGKEEFRGFVTQWRPPTEYRGEQS